MKRAIVVLATAVAAVVAMLVPGGATGHPERPTTFPNPDECFGGPPCKVPAVNRRAARVLVVCKHDSGFFLRRSYRRQRGRLRGRMRELRRCRYHNIQKAVDAAGNGTRIDIMPGLYREQPSRKVPFTPDACKDDFVTTEGNSSLPPPLGPSSNDPPVRPNFDFQHNCPNARNLIAIIGDKNSDGKCDSKCNLTLRGRGRRPSDVEIEGDRVKMDVIRGDRVDGLRITNLTVEYAAFNGIDVVETNGFRLDHILARRNQDYGILTFTADHGLYDRIQAHSNGDSGVYPGSTAKGNCTRYAIELRNIDSYHNTLGYSGTAGNSTWIHDSKFHDNASGISTDSFASGHPGMPQACAKWENNRIYSNNFHLFAQDNQGYCRTVPFAKREPERVCPQFQAPEGTGIIMYGADDNLVRNNLIYDNWRSGIRLFWIPAAIRGDYNPGDQTDTSNGNHFIGNRFGITPGGGKALNGVDMTWDQAGSGNCWDGNMRPGGAAITSEYGSLPACPGSSTWLPRDPLALVSEVPCAAWDPIRQPNPPGCSWFTLPPKPE